MRALVLAPVLASPLVLTTGSGGSAKHPANTAKIAGRKSGDIQEILGYSGGDEIIHRDDLVLLGTNQS